MTVFSPKVETKIFDDFNKQFIGHNENFNVQYRTFHTSLPKKLGTFKSLQKRRSVDKATVLGVSLRRNGINLLQMKKGNINYLIGVDV